MPAALENNDAIKKLGKEYYLQIAYPIYITTTTI